MSHLHHYLNMGLMFPETRTLVLFDTFDEARWSFHHYLPEANRLGVRAQLHQLQYHFLQGGFIRFAQLGDANEIMRYLGYEWANVFVDRLSNRALAQHAAAVLFKPVYRGDQNVV